MTATVAQIFEGNDFAELLAEAAAQADGEWETSFTHDMVVRYERFVDRMFITARQLATLGKIARREVPEYPREADVEKQPKRRVMGVRRYRPDANRKAAPKDDGGPDPDDPLPF